MDINWSYKNKSRVFDTKESVDAPYLSFKALDDTELIVNGSSTRMGGASRGKLSTMSFLYNRGDTAEDVLENLTRMAAALGVERDRVVVSYQTHTINLRRVTLKDAGKGVVRERDYRDIDGLITDVPGLTLVTSYVDCVPLYPLDPVNRVIGLSHSGWRGTAKRMGQTTVDAMKEAFGTKPEDLIAYVGPSICRDCFEVGGEVVEEFRRAFGLEHREALYYQGKRPGKYQLDLWKVNEIIFREAGICRENIHATNICTMCNSDYLFPHRKVGEERGNLAAFLCLKQREVREGKKKRGNVGVSLEEWSPVCSVQAVVEDNGQAVYFYLWVNLGSENAETCNCWICNRAPAMEDIDYGAMKMGMAPCMPRAYMTHDSVGICLDREKLSLTWFEEGDGAALYEDDKMIVVIPGWVNREFPGYSLYVKGMASFAWELRGALPILEQQMECGWMYWDIMRGGYSETMQQEQLAAMEAFFGPHEKYYVIDGGELPLKILVIGERKGNQYALILGNRALAQSKVGQYSQDETWKYRRTELGVAFLKRCSQEGVTAMSNYTVVQAPLPWKELGWLGHGHTIPCSGAEGYEGVLLLSPGLCSVQKGPAYPMLMDESVNLLQMMPLTGEEYELVKKQGTDPILEKKGADSVAQSLVRPQREI